MNTLSWMIYLSGLIENLNMFLFIIGMVIGLVLLGSGAAAGCSWEDNSHRDDAFCWIWFRHIRWAIPLEICLFLIVAVIPSQKTMMAIVASEAGQRIAESKSVQDIANPAMAYVKHWLEQQTKEK